MGAAKLIEDLSPEGFLTTVQRDGGLVYGPFANGPFGQNLGLNLLGSGAKVCSFDCPYCDLGHTSVRLNRLKTDVTLPTVEELTSAVNDAFRDIHANGPMIDGISISGNGEPTLHPEFPEIVRMVMQTRNAWMPGKPIYLYTNGASLDTRKISDSANLVDERIVKIDAGNERLFKAVNAPLSRANLARVLNGVRKMRNVIVQSLFFEGAMTNTSTTDIEDWLEVIAILRPKAVHIYGLTRVPADKGLVRCEQDTLYAIASRLERKTQIKALVIP